MGEDILTDLGISIDRQLEHLAEKSSADDDDPIPFEDAFGVGCTPGMIVTAIVNVFPADKKDKLWIIVYMYDVWRIRLGPDPPAKVPPLEIRLKKGATPFRCMLKVYPRTYGKLCMCLTMSWSASDGYSRTA
ncbi:hypothetical protein L917_12399 [Phytophthora nicotianae]|uniref:Uncharacterized protein n=1 Tax=Phytophthora nicotianae TaxID=4792 RepID=W2KVA7_PHYNI|nr:hypothetical protein L917_12399 [Phytophthora nicotianae]